MEISGSTIVFPVSNTVAYHHSLEVGNPASFGVVDKHIKSKHKLRNVDSSIWLSWNVEIVILKCGELVLKQEKYSLKSIISWVLICPNAFVVILTYWISDVSGALNPEHVGVIVPRPVIKSKVFISIFKIVRSIFLGPTKHRWAAGTTIEPYDHRIGCVVVTTQCCHVVELFLCAWNR